MRLEGSAALVTGAGRRIGRAIALDLAAAGCDVAVHYHSSGDAAAATVAEIRALGVAAIGLPGDLGRPDEAGELCAAAHAELGRLDILVNNAASFIAQPFDQVTVEDWERTMAVNLRAPFLLSQRAAAVMAAVPRESPGLIVNIADLSGVQGWRGYVQHSVSKAGLLHLTRLSARELAPGVRVNAVVPGAILPPPGTAADSEEWRTFGRRLPLERVGEPGHVGHAVRFLAENDFVTGAVLYVDGGEHLGGPRRH